MQAMKRLRCRFPIFSTSLSAVAIGKPDRHVRKASHRGSKQQ